MCKVEPCRVWAGDRRYEYTWFCCNCGADAGTTTINICCPMCGHQRCSSSSRKSPSSSRRSPPVKGIEIEPTWEDELLPEDPQQNVEDLETRTAMVDIEIEEEHLTSPIAPKELSELATDPLTVATAAPKVPWLVGSETHRDDCLDKTVVERDYAGAKDADDEPCTTHNDPDGRSKVQSSSSLKRVSGRTGTETDAPPRTSVWRERGVSSEHDSTDTGVCTPTGSDDSPWPESPESGAVMFTPGVTDDMDELDIGTGDGGSPSTHTLQTPSSEGSTGSSGDNLLEQPWFHHNVRRILRRLLQQWTGIRTRAEGQPVESSGTGSAEQQQQSSSRQQGSGKRKQNARQEEVEDQDDESTKPKRRKQFEQSQDTRGFACPFCKKDLQQYQLCAKFGFTRISYVKQHIKRNHSNDVDETRRSRLQRRSARGQTREQQWYEIFDHLFPGHSPRPITPYNDFTLSEYPPGPPPRSHDSPDSVPLDEALSIPREYLTGDGAEILQQALVQDPAFHGLDADDINSAVSRGLAQLLATLDHRHQQHISARTQHMASQHGSDGEAQCPPRESDSHVSDQQLHHLDDTFGDESEHPSGNRSSIPTDQSPASDADNTFDARNNGNEDHFQGNLDSLPNYELVGGQGDELGLDFTVIAEDMPWDPDLWNLGFLSGDDSEYLGDGSSKVT